MQNIMKLIRLKKWKDTPVAVDKDNYQELIVDGGYYTADQLAG